MAQQDHKKTPPGAGLDGGNRCQGAWQVASVARVLRWGCEMKRDDDLMRSILLEIEALDDPVYICGSTHDETAEDRIRYYHMMLLVDAGFLKGIGRSGAAFRMTNDGHDLLAMTRQSEAWEATKAAAKSLGGASFRVFLSVAESMVRDKLRAMGIAVGDG